ncbi:MAG TPA: Clp protease N-terminal domain-containing protein [Ktedonobacteraceae bacterium]|jgi:ATP-dependent Clp protease ATP-binding subunit ClpC|nr:Clp protease N-terminal domain-containing protein [Ktedonobacteraceae bacterium]
MPSSKDRQRIEVPMHFYEQLARIAETEDRTITSVLNQLLFQALQDYQPTWIPSKHLSRLNGRAQQVLILAREEALSFHHAYIGTEHLLLGLLREEEGLAALALAKLGVALEPVRAAVVEKIGLGGPPVQEEIDYVPRARKALSLALNEAERLGSAYVRTEHILLGLVREGGGVAADILDRLGVLGRVRSQIFELLG